MVMAKDRGGPAQRRPVARVPTPKAPLVPESPPFPSLPLPLLRFLPSNAFTAEERDCVSVPAAANGKWLKNGFH